MSSLNNITISSSEYRPCIVDGKKALFHKWNDFANTVGQEITIRRKTRWADKIYSWHS